ncbi:hypothetical protein V2G26_017261 [Clonostachys chloroleuca]|uniref:FAD-binding domain-containing protein n=1 Tax=Clonostachys chloroleuca TaxID=1926264 RepID=A0AA35MAN8_9HYPO|nr:unnamed protein product [Clonostachys chloroleuca]
MSNATNSAAGQSPKLDIAIAGGGIAGLITAIALIKHPGVNIHVYERAEELREIGASIALGPNGLSSLDKLGVKNAFDDDILYRQRSGWPMVYRHWKTSEIIGYDEHRNVKDKRFITTRYHRAHLHRALYENLPSEIVHFGKKLVNVSADRDQGVTLSFEDGTTANADICIGADGIHSTVRKTLVPEHKIHWTGWVALRAVYEQSRLDGVDYPEGAAHWIGHNRHLFVSPLGKGLYTVVGGYHANLDDPKSQGHGVRWDDQGDVEQFKSFYKDWHPAIRSITEAAPYIRQFPGYTADPLETWSFHDRIVLVGDAAHGHGGAFAAGGSLAINDAHALSLALFHVWPPSASARKPSVADLHKVFETYQATRKPQVDRLLDSVHKSVAGRRVKTDNGTEETDEQLRKRVSERMDPYWVAEHDVEAAFEAVVAKAPSSGHQVLGNKPPQALL